MRYIIYGAGGIGGVLGARLFRSGEQVVLIARGAHLEAMRAHGLRFRAPGEDLRLEIPVVGHPAEIALRSDDVVILCVKSQHSVAALEALRAAAGAQGAWPAVVCCQNGVANERAALRRFPEVYGMVVILPALHLQPGEVITHAEPPGGVLDIGRYPEGVGARAGEIARAVTGAGFAAEPDAAIMRKKYAKLLLNLNNALQAATAMPEEARPVSRMLREEALACYEAAGIDCATAEEMRARRAQIRPGAVSGVPRQGGSSWQSVVRGTGNIESDYLNGEIVLLGRLHGVPTPANAVVQALGAELVETGRAAGSVDIEAVKRRIASAQDGD